MDTDTRALLKKSVEDWCRERRDLLSNLECYPKHKKFPKELFEELKDLGLLHVAHDSEASEVAQMVAEIAHTLARFSPSVAVLVMQQNLASGLLAALDQPEPEGWIALPLYDSSAEWETMLTRRGAGGESRWSGAWHSIPALPIAYRALLPLVDHANNGASSGFALADIDFKKSSAAQVSRKPAGWSLGLRGCPSGDLKLKDASFAAKTLIAKGPKAADSVQRLWSRAEIYAMAIRSGIFNASYSRAREYAAERWQGGKMIIEHSNVKKMLARLYQEKCSLYETWRLLSQSVSTTEALTDGQMGLAMASAERLPWQTSDGIQLLGGNGYMEDYGQERCFRDAKQCEFLLGHPQAKSFATWQHEVV